MSGSMLSEQDRREWLTEVYYQRNPGRGRAAAIAEANGAIRDTEARYEAGRQRLKAAKTAKKAGRRQAREAIIAQAVTEALNTSAARRPIAENAPGPEAAAPAGLGAGNKSPFWRTEATGVAPDEVAAFADPGKPLHEMDPDEFRDHAAAEWSSYTAGQRFGSPSWK